LTVKQIPKKKKAHSFGIGKKRRSKNGASKSQANNIPTVVPAGEDDENDTTDDEAAFRLSTNRKRSNSGELLNPTSSKSRGEL
jgi:hypothetical protein